MLSRRRFLQGAAAAAVGSRPVFTAAGDARIQGANDAVRLAVVGTGSRGRMLGELFARQKDCRIVAACDVARGRLEEFSAKLGDGGAKPERYEDYRRILDRTDVDALVVATPDHWHAPMTIDACAAGKDVYVEKPVSNAIEPGRRMVEAARAHNRVVQVGLQQRHGEHFKEAARLVQSGVLGRVTHAVMQFGGSYTVPPEPAQPPPADLNWEMFQGPAPRRAYKPSRQLRWRSYYDYGGGLVTDWGVHLVDVAHWYLKLDTNAPVLTSASAQYVTVDNPERDQVPDAFIVSWQYDNVVMSFTNAVPGRAEFGAHGNYFFGPRGSLQVNRSGYEIRPSQSRPQPGSEPLEHRLHRLDENYQNDPSTLGHCRDFLDCIRSRQKPVSDIEVGFHSTLPCLLAILAIRERRSFTWDGKAARPMPS